MTSWIRRRRRDKQLAREASWVEERVVVTADSDWLSVVFEPMGAVYEIHPGEHLTIVFEGPTTDPGAVDHRADHVSVAPGLVGRMSVFDSAGDEIDVETGAIL
ncbi:hypothetical protein OG401_40175 [Kitasatospora purpeofusca]|uniref:hypothetical protein n=1 Tax=Kitasatospora purpeofusca TaxID=67352 RepID=UPI00224FA702|nr:hypothetical protein [Kitasatospora purpeofusca]MCX4690442.1 hypothetical protein [Kitasatospora purpeofusca]